METHYTEQMTLRLTKEDKIEIVRAAKKARKHPSQLVREQAMLAIWNETYLDYRMRGKALRRVFPEDAPKESQ